METAPIPRNLERYRHIYGIASFLPVDVDRPMVGLVVVDQFTPFERNCVRDRKAKPAHDQNQSPETRAPPISRLPVHFGGIFTFSIADSNCSNCAAVNGVVAPSAALKFFSPVQGCLLMRPVRKNQLKKRYHSAPTVAQR